MCVMHNRLLSTTKKIKIKSDTLEIIPPPPSGAQIHKTLFNFLQMLKQVSQYKLQMKALREQESDMRSQVHSQGIMGTCINFLSSSYFPGYPQSSAEMHHVLCVSPQLDMYSKKFDEIQGTVSKSNSVYSGFKQDMDKVRLFPQNI